MCNHLNLKILIHIFTIIYLIMIIIIMRDKNFVSHLDGLGGTPVCRGTPDAHHGSLKHTQRFGSWLFFRHQVKLYNLTSRVYWKNII
jgi:hypothetical protein